MMRFLYTELLSLASYLNIDFQIPKSFDNKSPYLIVELPSEEHAKRIMARTVMVKSLLEVWVQASSYEEMKTKIQDMPSMIKKPYFEEDQSFCVRVDSFNKNLSFEEKLNKIKCVLDEDTLPFKGNVDLKHPKNTFHILEDYSCCLPQSPDLPHTIYMGRWICNGHRDHIQKYHLQKRKYIGNTSMDAQLSLMMANMGKVKPGSLVFDPFVGTGSLLIASAHFGGYVLGTDLDYKTIHGIGRSSRSKQKWRTKDENVFANFVQYGLEDRYLGVLVADASNHKMWHGSNLFDAIITDPPYGIREKTKRVGSDKDDVIVEDEHKDGHVPEKVEYEMSDIMKDLLNFSAKYLKVGGRLVYWLPVVRPEYVEDNIPQHPCLNLIANSEQPLNVRIGRRLITMEKTKDIQENSNCEAMLAEDLYGGDSFRNKYFKVAPHFCHTSTEPNAHQSPHSMLSSDLELDSLEQSVNEISNALKDELKTPQATRSACGDS